MPVSIVGVLEGHCREGFKMFRQLDDENKNTTTIILIGIGAGLVLGVLFITFYKTCQKRKPPQFEDFIDPYGQEDIPAPISAKAIQKGGNRTSRFHSLAYQNQDELNQEEMNTREKSRVALLEDVVTPCIPSESIEMKFNQNKPPSRHGSEVKQSSRQSSVVSGIASNDGSIGQRRNDGPSVPIDRQYEESKHARKSTRTKQTKSKPMSDAETRAAKKAQLISQLGSTGLVNNMKMIQSMQVKETSPMASHVAPVYSTSMPRVPVSREPNQFIDPEYQREFDDQPYETCVNNANDTMPLGAEAGNYARTQKKQELIQMLPPSRPSPMPLEPGYRGEDEMYLTDANHPDDTLPLGAEAGTYRKKAELLASVKAPPAQTQVVAEYQPFDADHVYETSHVYDSMPLGMEAGQYRKENPKLFEQKQGRNTFIMSTPTAAYQDQSTPRMNEPRTNQEDGIYSELNPLPGSVIIPIAANNSKTTKLFPRFKFVVFMIAINVVVFVIEIGVNGWTVESMKINPLVGPSAEVLLKMGAQRTDLVLNGEWWRLLTAMFLHGGVLHLLFNMMALHQLGTELEATFDRRRIVFIYFCTGLIGGMCSSVFVPNTVGVGASGAIFGLFGATFAEFFLNWELYTNRFWHVINLVVVAIVNLGIGLLPYVNNFAHLSGFLSGLGLGFAFLSLPVARQDRIQNTRTIKQRRLMYGGGIFSFTFGLVFLILLATHTDASKSCPWCKYIDCIPAPWWTCEPVTGDCLGETFTNGTLIVTCPGGRVTRAPDGSEFTAEVCKSLCT